MFLYLTDNSYINIIHLAMVKRDDAKLKMLLQGVDREKRTLEFKDAFSWLDNHSLWLKEKTIKAILGMTNTPTGGNIVIGIKEDDSKQLIIKGMSKEEIESFANFESIKGEVDAFSSCPIDFDIFQGEYNGKLFIVITVPEFEEMPAICKKNGSYSSGKGDHKILYQHDIYVRAKKGHASTIKATEIELREIIRMAADKEKHLLKERGYERVEATDIYAEQIADLEVE